MDEATPILTNLLHPHFHRAFPGPACEKESREGARELTSNILPQPSHYQPLSKCHKQASRNEPQYQMRHRRRSKRHVKSRKPCLKPLPVQPPMPRRRSSRACHEARRIARRLALGWQHAHMSIVLLEAVLSAAGRQRAREEEGLQSSRSIKASNMAGRQCPNISHRNSAQPQFSST